MSQISIQPKEVSGANTDKEADFRKLTVSYLVKKYPAQAIHEYGKSLGINTANLNISAIISSIKTLLNNAEKLADPGYQRFISSAAAPLIDPTVHQYGIRCVYCGTICVEIQPGFDPKRPTNVLGKPIPFHLWPFRFLGPPDKDPTELAASNRENPSCHFCFREIPLESSGARVLSRAIVVLKEAKPESGDAETQAAKQ